MSVKGTVLENYRFDARDFSESQLEDLKVACMMRKGNKELQPKLLSAIEYQSLFKKKYFRRVGEAKREVYMKHLRTKNFKLFRIPDWISLKYELLRNKSTEFLKSSIPSQISIFTEDRMEWPEIIVPPESVSSLHLVASMPPECLNITGWERLKRAVLPSRNIKYYDPKDPSHTYNMDVFVGATVMSSMICGCFQGYGHAKRDLNSYKNDAASQLHESKYRAFRAREFIFVQSLGKYGIRWGWRVGFLFATTYAISQFWAVYTLEDRVHHYLLGAGVASAAYMWKLGLSGMLKTGVLGAIFIGLPIGILSAGLGYNPRIAFYFTNVETKVHGPLTEEAMTPKQRFLGYEKRLAILNLLRMPHSDEINSQHFYRDFVGAE